MILWLPIKMSSQKIDCGHKTLAEAVWDERGIYDDRKLVLHVSLVFPVCLQILPAPQTQALAPLFPNILQLLIFAVVKTVVFPATRVPSLTLSLGFLSSMPSVALSHLYGCPAIVELSVRTCSTLGPWGGEWGGLQPLGPGGGERGGGC